MDFDKKYRELNAEQRRAVDQVDGPVMIVAGPGTGKTQLLSLRVANILRQTDAGPGNILCLTFTENGAQNMVERLSGFIGADAHKVVVGTFHAFGIRIIGENREYFAAHLNTPIDELRQHQILSDIVDKLPAHNPLHWTEIYQIMSLISELKKAAIDPENLQQIIQENIDNEKVVNEKLDEILAPIKGKSARSAGAKLDEIRAVYEDVLGLLCTRTSSSIELYAADLRDASNAATDNSKPLTTWKNENTTKDKKDRFALKNHGTNNTLLHVAEVYKKYQESLSRDGFYDYDDMILELIRALGTNDDLRFSLQERFQYILVDEFQDTNDSQCRIIELLTDNPVNENRPNVMVVGDDDQAIMGFQGAHSANWEIFAKWRDVTTVNLVENYRSSREILTTAESVAGQITIKPNILSGIVKKLIAKNEPPKTDIKRIEFNDEIAEMRWVAEQIAKIPVDERDEIAVIAPKHKLLERIMPFLRTENIAVNYERRENILDSKLVQQITDVLELATGLIHDGAGVRHLWPRVLSQDFWQIPAIEIWRLAWAARAERKSWTEMSDMSDKIRFAVEFIEKLAVVAETENFDTLLGIIIGTVAVDEFYSPFKEYYMGQPDDILFNVLNNLTILREKFAGHGGGKSARDFLDFIRAHQQANIKIVGGGNYRSGGTAVNLMTPHGAKGLEFKHVFLPFLNQKDWASGAGNNHISLPNNLAHIRNSGREDGEKLRVLFVAMTRAKSHLYLSSSLRDHVGKPTEKLVFIDGIPCHKSDISGDTGAVHDVEKLWSDAWRDKHAPIGADLRELLRERIENLSYTATNLTKFYDAKYGGPMTFYEDVILDFPTAASDSIEFGNIVHEILDRYARAEIKPSIDAVMEQFASFVGDPSRGFTAKTRTKLIEKAEWSLPKFFAERAEMLSRPARTEQSFNAVVDGVKIRGKVDRIEIDDAAKKIVIVDFKTGKAKTAKDHSDVGLHKNIIQLYFYKILLQNSPEFANFSINGGRLEFVEADPTGDIADPIEISFDPEYEKRVMKLLKTMHDLVNDFNFPLVPSSITNKQSITAKDVIEFEDLLIDN